MKTRKELKNVIMVDDAVVKNSLGYLRDKTSEIDFFRHHSDIVCRYLFAAAIKELAMQEREIETPLAQMRVEVMDGNVVVIPILRAGIAMLQGALQSLPKAKIGFVGLKRDEETAIAQEYYWNLPEMDDKSTVIITDPMLATGGTITHVLRQIAHLPMASTRVVSVVAAPEGIRRVNREFPKVLIYTAAVDKGLNDKAYVVPGLGDYGDRYFGT